METTSTSAGRNTLDIRREMRRCPACERRFSKDAVFCPYDGSKLDAAILDSYSDPLIGAVVDGRYEIAEVLGEGGMGRVYRVRHLALDRSFALKALRRDLARDEGLVERFLHEARATAAVKHPNIVQINDFGRFADKTPYFVMELLSGHTLGHVIKTGGPLPAAYAARIIRQVAAGLGAAHAAGVVHRDLKPDNVFLVGGSPSSQDEDRNRARAMLGDVCDARVVDFGASKIIGSSRMTQAGIVFGTPHYMSPEQASGATVDHRADIYSLGTVMYEMFTGRVPFEADSYMGVLTKHMFVQPVPPSQISEAASELGALEEITLICLQKRPEDRFASMGDLVEAIDGVVRSGDEGEPVIAKKLGPLPRRSQGRPKYRMADELEPPTLEEVRVASARYPFPGTALIAPLVAGGTLLVFGLVGAMIALRSRSIHPETVPSTTATATPVTTATTTTSAIPPRAAETTPVETLVEPIASAPFDSPPTRAPVPPPKPPKRNTTASPPAPSAVDDVGDPFEGTK